MEINKDGDEIVFGLILSSFAWLVHVAAFGLVWFDVMEVEPSKITKLTVWKEERRQAAASWLLLDLAYQEFPAS